MSSDSLGVLIPILAVGLSLSIPIVGIVSDYRKRRSLIEALHAERMAAIEKGVELPELPDGLFDARRAGRRSTLLPGLIWLFVGLAILAGTQVSGVFDFNIRGYLRLIGGIPTAVGLAFLIYHAVEGRKVQAALLAADAAHANADAGRANRVG